MKREVPSLGDLEIQVLRTVWQTQPCTERSVWEAMCTSRQVGRTTVLKTLQRLEAKGLLVRRSGRGPVQYRAVVNEGRLLPDIVRRFVEGTLAGSLEPLVSYLADSAELSTRDAAALRAIARKMAAAEKPTRKRGR